MFLQRLVMDAEEERRRRLRRARIIRRNRIKREVALGLPVRIRRVPKPTTPAFDGTEDLTDWADQSNAQSSPFRPTFGDNGDDARPPRPDMIHASQSRSRQFAPVQSTAKRRARVKTEPSPSPLPPTAANVTIQLINTAADAPLPPPRPTDAATTRQIKPLVLKRWQEAVDQVLVRRHTDILSKDPERKWRQERLGLRLLARGDFSKAAQHLTKAVSLGVSTGSTWRRLAQCQRRHWEVSGDWTALWDCRVAYEQALAHVEVASNPQALFEYSQALEALGDYSDALSVCSTLLNTFPKFQNRQQVTLRYVLLQRYQLFSMPGSASNPSQGGQLQHTASGDAGTASIDRQAALLKCIKYTKELLLDPVLSEGDQCIEVLYMHARLNELLVLGSGSEAVGVAAISKASNTVALATATADHCFDELLRAAVKLHILSNKVVPAKKPWRQRSETYTAFAQFFQARNEPIPASDALARALELLEEPILNPSETSKAVKDALQDRIELYLVLGRTYYQSNQMEKAVRAMEAVFDMDPLHSEARASLAEWFPDKWKFRLDLEDASQVQIARVLRGIWGRNRASTRRKTVEVSAEKQWKLQPYDRNTRKLVLKLLRAKYAPLFAAQDVAARVIQQQARRFLRLARLRWADTERRVKIINDLLSKFRTRKYRYNRHIRAQLARLLPQEFETRFRQEEAACRLVQRYYRGYRVRCDFQVRRDARRAAISRVRVAVDKIQRFLLWCMAQRRQELHLQARTVNDLLLQAQHKIFRAKERVALSLQSLYRRRHRDSTDAMASLVLSHSQASGVCITDNYRSKCAKRIQQAWKRYFDGQFDSNPSFTAVIEAIRPGTGRPTARKTVTMARDSAARKIQAQYRRRTTRKSLGRLKRVPGIQSPSVIQSLAAKMEENHRQGVESRVVLSSLETIEQRRALFENSAVVFKPRKRPMSSGETHPEDDTGSSETLSLVSTRHLANAIQFSAVLRCLVITSGEFAYQGVVDVMKAVGAGKALRVLALGAITTTSELESTSHPQVKSVMQTLSLAVRTANFLLEELYLEDNDLFASQVDSQVLAEIVGDFFFARYGRLHTLAVARMKLADAAAELLAAALAINTTLKRLDLHGNRLSDSTASAFATRGLPFNATLRYLNLADNVVGSAGAIALFQCLEDDNQTLETLVLTNNNVQNDAVDALKTAWMANAALESVELDGNLVHCDHLQELAIAADERRAVAPTSAELRLFLARRRFSIDRQLSPLVLKGGGATRPAVLSPHRWIQQRVGQDEKVLVSPIQPPAVVYKARKKPPSRSPMAHSPPSSVSKLKRVKKTDGYGARREVKLPVLDSRTVW